MSLHPLPTCVVIYSFSHSVFLKSSPKDMLIDFRERGREGERDREKHQCEGNIDGLLLVHALMGD